MTLITSKCNYLPQQSKNYIATFLKLFLRQKTIYTRHLLVNLSKLEPTSMIILTKLPQIQMIKINNCKGNFKRHKIQFRMSTRTQIRLKSPLLTTLIKRVQRHRMILREQLIVNKRHSSIKVNQLQMHLVLISKK